MFKIKFPPWVPEEDKSSSYKQKTGKIFEAKIKEYRQKLQQSIKSRNKSEIHQPSKKKHFDWLIDFQINNKSYLDIADTILLEVIVVDKNNLMDTVIKDGYAQYEDVYANVPADQRPKQ